MLDEAHAAVVVPLVLRGHAADLHHHLPQLLGRAPALFRPRELLAGGGQQLTQLSGGGGRGEQSVIGGGFRTCWLQHYPGCLAAECNRPLHFV